MLESSGAETNKLDLSCPVPTLLETYRNISTQDSRQSPSATDSIFVGLAVEASSLKLLFDMGCGFTEFLCQMFSYLSWTEVLCCRGVCRLSCHQVASLVFTSNPAHLTARAKLQDLFRDWKEFVDEFVSHRHPATTDYHRWTEGSVECSHLLCAGAVERLVSDEDYIYCAMQESISSANMQ